MTIFADATDIDEALADAARGIVDFNEEENNRLTHLLTQAKDPGVRPFAEGIDAVNRVYNRPFQVLTDSENVYVLRQRVKRGRLRPPVLKRLGHPLRQPDGTPDVEDS